MGPSERIICARVELMCLQSLPGAHGRCGRCVRICGSPENAGADKPHGRHAGRGTWGVSEPSLPAIHLPLLISGPIFSIKGFFPHFPFAGASILQSALRSFEKIILTIKVNVQFILNGWTQLKWELFGDESFTK